MINERPTTSLDYELEVPIDAARAEVWIALTDETNAWWLPDFHMVGEGSVVELDARAGGQLVERREGGGSLLWYTVMMCTPGVSMTLVGYMAPEYGGPATTMLELQLVEDGDTTILRVRDALFGRCTKKGAESLRDGWRTLFTDGLAAHLKRTR